jgi:hypothetical protein
MLIHAMLSWPDIITEDLWPFAVQLAVDLHNMTPTSTGASPQEIFSVTKHNIDPWKPRSRVGVYLGFSSYYASTVPLVLSTTTGLVSPQFHVVFDDNFSTVQSFKNNQLPTNWPELFNTTATSYVDEDFTSTNIYDNSFFES